MSAVDLSGHPGHLARRLQQVHYLLWNTMVSEQTTSPQFAVLNTLVASPGLDQRTVGERVGLDRSTIAEVISSTSPGAACCARRATRATAAARGSPSPTRAARCTANSPSARPG